MTNYKIIWNEQGKKEYHAGVDRGVLYPINDSGVYNKGVAFNGLTQVNENPSGGEATAKYADNHKWMDLRGAEEFGGTIGAFMYPDEFAECDGSKEIAPGVYAGQQSRKVFGFCYRTILGNDIKKDNYGYILHLVYGCTVAPSGKDRQTINNSPDIINFSWAFTSTPVPISGGKQTATLELDSTKISKAGMEAIEKVLYGYESNEPRLPLPDEVVSIITQAE